MHSLQYRPATPGDMRSIFELYMHADANPFLVYDVMDDIAFGSLFTKLLAEGEMVVVEQDGQVVASYHLFNKEYRQADTVYLATLVIHPSFKRKGAAIAVLQHIVATARAAGKNRLELEVSVNNPNAIALYEKMGFEIEGRIRQSYRIGPEKTYYDDYLMGLLL